MKARATKGKKPALRERFRISEFVNPSGEVAFRVSGTKPDGVRVRENFRSRAEAVGRKGELDVEAQNIKTDFVARLKPTRLTDEQIKEAEAAVAALGRAGRRSLLEAVRFYLDNFHEPETKISVADALTRFLAEKKSANLRPASLDNLRIKTLPLLHRHGAQLVAEIQPDALRGLINTPGRGPKSRDNYRRGLSSFFAWAQVQGFCRENPAAKIDPIKAERHEPAILSVGECAALLNAAAAFKQGALLPYVALGLFAGLRPTELARLDWSRVDVAQCAITIGADVAKMRGRRIVEISPNLAAILAPFALRKLPIVGANWRRDFDAIKEAAGFGTATQDKPDLKPWTQDVLRHTAISYHLAKHQHEGRTATWAGNSPDIIQRHYRGLVKPADAEAFWKLTVDARAANVVALQAA